MDGRSLLGNVSHDPAPDSFSFSCRWATSKPALAPDISKLSRISKRGRFSSEGSCSSSVQSEVSPIPSRCSCSYFSFSSWSYYNVFKGGNVKLKTFMDSLKHACKVPNTDQPYACVDMMVVSHWSCFTSYYYLDSYSGRSLARQDPRPPPELHPADSPPSKWDVWRLAGGCCSSDLPVWHIVVSCSYCSCYYCSSWNVLVTM